VARPSGGKDGLGYDVLDVELCDTGPLLLRTEVKSTAQTGSTLTFHLSHPERDKALAYLEPNEAELEGIPIQFRLICYQGLYNAYDLTSVLHDVLAQTRGHVDHLAASPLCPEGYLITVEMDELAHAVP
jgi:hypothetical protein